MPLGVVYTKSYNIWDDINPFLQQLADGYVKSQQTKADNELTLSWIADIEKANTPTEVKGLLEMQEQFKKTIDVEGFKKDFAIPAMGLLAQKEMVMNPEDFQTKTVEKPVEKQTKVMPDVKEFNSLFKFVSELSLGKIDYSGTLDVFKKQLESGRAMSSIGQQFLQMIMGQSMPTDQRQKVQQDFEFTKDIHKTLYPGEQAPTSDYERWKKDPEGFAEFKAVGKAEPENELKIDVMKFLEENQDEWEFGSINSKGDFTIRRKNTTKKYDFLTWEEANKWTKSHPQEGFDWVIDPQPEGFNVSAKKKTVTPTGGTNKITPTYGVINTINEALSDPGKDYDTELHNAQIKYNLEGVKLVTKADQALNAYNMFEGIILDEDNQYIDEKGYVKDEEAYADYYSDYEKFTEIYFKETGKILPKKYLSMEEAGQYQKNQWALGVGKGSDRPVRNEDGIPWSWQTGIDPTEALYNEMQKTGTKPEDYDLERLAKEKGIDIEKLNNLFSGGM